MNHVTEIFLAHSWNGNPDGCVGLTADSCHNYVFVDTGYFKFQLLNIDVVSKSSQQLSIHN